MPVGTYGKINTAKLDSSVYESRTRFRDYDGQTRQVRAVGATAAKAEANLKTKLRDRQKPVGGTGVTRDTRTRDLADQWLATNGGTRPWSAGTRETYGYVVKRNIVPALGGIRVSEWEVPVIDKALETVRDKHGDGAATTMKTCLSGMAKLAIRHGALSVNPVRDAIGIPRGGGRARTLTPEQVNDVLARLRDNEWAITHDIPDLADWMLYTGARIGESCATRPGVNDEGEEILDLEHGVWEVNATVKRISGVGLFIQPRPKSAAGWRRLALPDGAVELVQRRQAQTRARGPFGVVFPSPMAKALRDPSNTPGDLRVALDAIGCEHCHETGWLHDDTGQVVRDKHGLGVRCDKGPYSWVTSHVFRKTVATRLRDAGVDASKAADHLGHSNPSMTQDRYFGRTVTVAEAAAILDR
jgi:integrase